MSRDIDSLKTVLFKTLDDLNNRNAPLNIDRAKAINDIAQTLVNIAKVEIQAAQVLGGKGTKFIPPALPQKGNVVEHEEEESDDS